MAVIGTAGHVDHGKTTLVRALTGVDTDRLPEEKRRGITIELGFAPMRAPSGAGDATYAIVDVPGHESFVGTMVSGAQGVDVALLVVAADAGVMPQTREHLVILDGLGIPELVVALTRSDVADAETRALAKIDVEETIAATRWKSASIVEVSGKTGEGVEALRRSLVEACARVEKSERRQRPARLAIDRAFVPRGQGVVVTGTLVSGVVRVGDELDELPVAPQGAREGSRRVRVRGLHQHGQAATQSTASGRVAVALGGVELADVRRGDVLAAPGTMMACTAFDAIFTRPTGGRAFGRRARVTVHAGTDESTARLVPLGTVEPVEAKGAEASDATKAGATTIGGGERRIVRVVLARPLAVAVGDRVIARGDARLANVGTTLGALEVLRVAPGRLRGGRASYLESLRGLLAADARATAAAKLEIESAGLSGIDAAALVPRLERRALSKDVARTLVPLEIRTGATQRWVGAAARTRVRELLLGALERHHAQHPDDDGAPVATVTSAVPANAAPGLADVLLEQTIAAGDIVRVGERLRRSTFQPRARADDPQALAIQKKLESTALAPPSLAEIAKELGLETSRARSLAGALAASGKIVHVQGDLWFARPPLDELRTRLIDRLRAQGSITTGEFKELVGASRKYVVPLAEWFDAERVTLRVGDVRKLRQAG